MESQKQSYQILGDQPFLGDDDPFGFVAVAHELKNLILRSRDATPFTIGIEASWGRGKSSLMGQLIREFEKSEKVAPTEESEAGVEIRKVPFNAWSAEGSDVLEGLIKSVLNSMDPSLLRRSLRNQKIIGYLRVPFLILASSLRLGGLADEIWARLSVDARRRNQINEVVRGAMEDWRKRALKKTGKGSKDRLIIVSIDDLDRCSPENVLKVFEAVKVYLNAPGFIFIIGYDRDAISDAILDQKNYSKEVTGVAYIEKIVQTVFRIPLPDEDQINALLEFYLEASGTSSIFDENDRKLLIDRNSRNPRRIKRFINRFILDYRLDESSVEYDPELLIKVLLFETYFPSFARRLYEFESKKNPLQEFLDFSAAYAELQRDEADQAVAQAFFFYGLSNQGSAQERLASLKGAVPESFNSLITDSTFTSLVGTFSKIEDQEMLIKRVQRRKALNIAPESQSLSEPSGTRTDEAEADVKFDGASIVWIDDHPENNHGMIEWLVLRRAFVHQSTTSDEALATVASMHPTLVISDIDREGDQKAGFKDIARIQSEGYSGPVIFYTATITRSRREAAADLGAMIIDTEEQLRSAIVDLLWQPPEAQTKAVSA